MKTDSKQFIDLRKNFETGLLIPRSIWKTGDQNFVKVRKFEFSCLSRIVSVVGL